MAIVPLAVRRPFVVRPCTVRAPFVGHRILAVKLICPFFTIVDVLPFVYRSWAISPKFVPNAPYWSLGKSVRLAAKYAAGNLLPPFGGYDSYRPPIYSTHHLSPIHHYTLHLSRCCARFLRCAQRRILCSI